MTTQLTHPDCRCGHDRPAHYQNGFAPQCTAARCTCLRYQPADQNTPTPRATTDNDTTIDQLVAAGRRSSTRRIATLAQRVHDQAATLRALLAAERSKAEATRRAEADKQAARREVERLEVELAAAKAKLRGKPAPAAPTARRDTLGRRIARDATPKVCPDCGQTFQALGPHRARKHGYRRKPA
jgi:hypothetical protein